MPNYQIITDEAALRNFIAWLPELEDSQKYYLSLMARKKYDATGVVKSDKSQLKRFLAGKDRLLDKIRQLEVAHGAYTVKGEPVPQEALALYITPNPRDLRQATYDSIIQLTQLLKKKQPNFNPHAEVLSCIQRSPAKKHYLDFDVDDKDFDFEQLRDVINVDCLEIMETRGGYHILVRLADLDPQYQKTFYPRMKAMNVDQVGDQLLPVPGCVQGGFTPRFVQKFK